MPFADPEKSREYHRERRRAQRRQVIDQRVEQNFCQPLPATPLPAAPAVADVVALLADELNRVRSLAADSIMRGRAVAYIAGVLVDCIKSSEIENRIEKLEQHLAQRNGR